MTTPNSSEPTAGLVKDPATKVYREINTEYKASTLLPGATVIPSHRNDHGAQEGGRKPIKVIIDPDMPDGGQSFMLTPNQFGKADGTSLPVKEAAPKVPEQKLVRKQRKKAVAQVPEVKEVSTMAHDSLKIQDNISNEPTLDVTFELEDGSKIMTHFHALVINGSTMVLIYDRTFKYGTRYMPPVNSEKSITITVPKHNQSYKALYVGQFFAYGPLDHLVLLLEEEE